MHTRDRGAQLFTGISFLHNDNTLPFHTMQPHPPRAIVTDSPRDVTDQLLSSIFSAITVAAAFLLSAQLHPVLSANEN